MERGTVNGIFASGWAVMSASAVQAEGLAFFACVLLGMFFLHGDGGAASVQREQGTRQRVLASLGRRLARALLPDDVGRSRCSGRTS